MASVTNVFFGAASQPYNTNPNFSGTANYVAVGLFGINSSSDGINWNTVHYSNDFDFNSGIWDGSKFLVVGNSIGAISYDGYAWGTKSFPGSQSIAYGNGIYVCINRSNIGGTQVYYSNDGLTWSVSNTLPVDQIPGAGLTRVEETIRVDFCDGVFVITGRVFTVAQQSFAARWLSIDGINWIYQRLSVYGVISSIAQQSTGDLTNGVFSIYTDQAPVQQPYLNVTLFSDFTNVYGITPIVGNNLSLAWDNNTNYVATIQQFNTQNNYIFSSNDKVNWTQRIYPGDFNLLNTVTYKSGLFYIVGQLSDGKQALLVSADSINWTLRPMFDGIETGPKQIIIR